MGARLRMLIAAGAAAGALALGPGTAAAGITDAVPPQTTITSGPASGQTVPQDGFTFEFSSSEPFSTFECSVDGAPFGACASPFTAPGLPAGEHVFRVRAIDGSGNVDPTPATRSARVADCAGARSRLAAAEAAVGKTSVALATAKAKRDALGEKAKKRKVKRAKRKVRKARAKHRTAKASLASAQAEVAAAC